MDQRRECGNRILAKAIRRQLLGLAFLGAASAVAPAGAQTEGFKVEEIVVTATKQETTLSDTGLSISAYTADTLQQLGIDDVNDLSANTPGLTIAAGTNTERISIRGIGIDSLALGIDPAVATYADGFYFGSSLALYTVNNFFDVERIEVLRGPQGTLYGRNTAGGAINIVSKKPQPEFGGEVNLEAGSLGYAAVQGVLNIPLGDKFAWRVSASKIDRDALLKNDAGPDVDEVGNTSWDTTLRASWTDTWTTDLRVLGYKREGRPTSGYALDPYNTTTRVFPGALTINHTWGWDQPNPGVEDESKTSQDYPNALDEDATVVVLTNVFALGDVEVKYIGGYQDFTREFSADVDHSSAVISSSVNDILSEAKIMSHELQFTSNFDGKLNFIGGLYYYQTDEDLYYAFRNAVDNIYSTPLTWNTELVTLALASPTYSDRFPLATLPGPLMSAFVLNGFRFPDFEGDPLNRVFWFETSLKTTSYAGYGQLRYEFSDKLKMTLGLRYSTDEKKGAETIYAFAPMSEDFGPIPLGGGLFGVIESETHNALGNSIAYPLATGDIASAKQDWDNLGGLARLEYSFDQGGMLYGSISTGYRSGGFNLGGTAPGVDDFKEETVVSYEGGYKGVLLNNSLLLDVSAFYYDYSDLQVVQSYIDPDTGTQGTELNNAAQAEVTGLEAQLTWLLSESVRLWAGYSYTDATYKDFITIDKATLAQEEVDLSGNKLNRAPENKFNFGASYWLSLGSMGSLTLTAGYLWVDEMYTNPFNDERGKLDSWHRTDARATWLSESGSIAVTAFVKNIEDERVELDRGRGTIADGFLRRSTLSDPRLYGLQLNYKF